ncbi:hypothetical protein [Frigoriglobus tundricola]|uniref:Uncharacterized protein n=1 Tax=Frigoriglobus tundricola TaxID=2774151 RepID=A0A6M5Z3N0_9BACT|nr:hypothetical protein [Frigoriglobus tundricola]QJX00074.1 hypothetical protein FTUN_7698 [Frigoriglobus tundricola]
MPKKPAPKEPSPPSGFQINSITHSGHNFSSDASEEVLRLFQKMCHSREELLEFLIAYSTKEQLLGIYGRRSSLGERLNVSFTDTDGGSYTLCVQFEPTYLLDRDYPADEEYPHGSYAEIEVPDWEREDLLRWQGSDERESR